MSNIDKQKLVKVLDQAGKLLLEYFKKDSKVELKSNRDILHEADLKVNEFILNQLNLLYPGIFILSEESENTDTRHDEYFVLDPLDGTINFSRGIDEYGISLAYINEGHAEIGIVLKPSTKELFETEVGRISTLNKQKLLISSTGNLNESIIAIDPPREEELLPAYFETIHNTVRVVRSYGCAVHTLGLVAEGKIDAYIFNKPKYWDIAAMKLIISNAGGKITNFNGEEWQSGDPILISNSILHQDILKIINETLR